MANNWHTGGPYSERGYRIPTTKTGAKFSQHKLSKAIDLSSDKYTPAQILEAMRANFDKFKELGILTVENLEFTPTWLHMDCRQPLSTYPKNDFFIVDPA